MFDFSCCAPRWWTTECRLKLFIWVFLWTFPINVSLQLLRSSLVNNRTQAEVCDDIGMTDYMPPNKNVKYKLKHRADLLEAFLGALYVDKVRFKKKNYYILFFTFLFFFFFFFAFRGALYVDKVCFYFFFIRFFEMRFLSLFFFIIIVIFYYYYYFR